MREGDQNMRQHRIGMCARSRRVEMLVTVTAAPITLNFADRPAFGTAACEANRDMHTGGQGAVQHAMRHDYAVKPLS